MFRSILLFGLILLMIGAATAGTFKHPSETEKINSNVGVAFNEECTIGVASGKATADGRPLLWKTRDALSIDNKVYCDTLFKYKFISVSIVGYESYSFMGVNEKGFAIINSYAPDLPGQPDDNCLIMTSALGNCVTVKDFNHLLDSTNVTGRLTQANYGVIDSTGAAAIFEAGANQYWLFDAADSNQAPDGYILRTNFSLNGGGNFGMERYKRTEKIIGDFHNGDSLNYKSILRYQMRDFSDFNSNPFSIPYPHQLFPEAPFGYVYTSLSICGSNSVSAAVIQGVLSNESAKSTTMWTILGQPAATIAVPFWPIGNVPGEAEGNPTSSLCDMAIKIKSILFKYFYVSQFGGGDEFIDTYKLYDGYGNGLWARTFPAEDSIFAAAENLLRKWRTDSVNVEDMLKAESSLAQYALSVIQAAYDDLATSISTEIVESTPQGFELSQNYPNPFNPATTIEFALPKSAFVTLKVYNLLGEEVATLIAEQRAAGIHQLNWDASGLASGVYLYRLEAGGFIQTKKLILMR